MTPEEKKIEEAVKAIVGLNPNMDINNPETRYFRPTECELVDAIKNFIKSDIAKEYWQKDMFSKEFVIELMESIGVDDPVNYLKHFQEKQATRLFCECNSDLKEQIRIEGFNAESDVIQYIICETKITILYSGKTSDISEELAKDLLDKGLLYGFYGNITAKETIQSHCKQEYCVITSNKKNRK